LGDSVYAVHDGYGIRVYLNNGYGEKNPIYMEPEVLRALRNFDRNIRKAYAQPSSPPVSP
jgi:hypothetical protein